MPVHKLGNWLIALASVYNTKLHPTTYETFGAASQPLYFFYFFSDGRLRADALSEFHAV